MKRLRKIREIFMVFNVSTGILIESVECEVLAKILMKFPVPWVLRYL